MEEQGKGGDPGAERSTDQSKQKKGREWGVSS